MRVVLTKDYAVHKRLRPKGTEFNCTKEKGEELIALKVAKPIDGFTKNEIETMEVVLEKNEETLKPKVKKVAKDKTEQK